MSIRKKDLPEHVQRMLDGEKSKRKVMPAIARVPGRMNKTEAAFFRVVEVRRMGGEFAQVGFETVTFRLGYDCRYTPDVACWTPNGNVVCFEVKGRKGRTYYARDDSLVKLRAAAAMYPKVKFILVWPDGEGWETKEIQQ